MSTNDSTTTFTNREFVTLVRAELSAAGRDDVSIERSWIREDEPGEPFLLLVPVGADLAVPLRPMNGFFHAITDDDRAWHAREFAKALINLRSAEKALGRYARNMRRAAAAAVAAARADGLDILLDRVGFKPTYANHMTGKSWKDAASYVISAVTIRQTSFYLQPTTSELWVGEVGELEHEIEGLLDDQRERQRQMTELDAKGADLEVDGITLELLAAHGLDAAEALQTVWQRQRASFDIEHRGQSATLSLVSGGGEVTACLTLPEAIWNGSHLWLRETGKKTGNGDLAGKSLGDLVPHPVFQSRPIIEVETGQTDQFVFDLGGKSLFDGDTGRVWQAERLAA